MSTENLKAILHTRVFKSLTEEEKANVIRQNLPLFVNGKEVSKEEMKESMVKDAIIDVHFVDGADEAYRLYSPGEIQSTEIVGDVYQTFDKIVCQHKGQCEYVRFYMKCLDDFNSGLEYSQENKYLNWYVAGDVLVFFNDEVKSLTQDLVDEWGVFYNYIAAGEEGKIHPSPYTLDNFEDLF